MLKAVIKITKDYRARVRWGGLRAAILTGTTLLGAMFITAAERAGVFLSDDMPPRKFPKFLADLRSETNLSANQDWSLLYERLDTYCAYQQFAAALVQDEKKASALLRARPRFIIKKVLALTNLLFLRHYFGFKVPSEPAEWLDELGSPEEVASVASILVARANEVLPLDSYDLGLPAIDKLATYDMRTLMRYGKALMHQHEVAKDVSLFGYRLELVGNGDRRVFYLRPAFPSFEYAIRLGFIRAEMGWANIPAEVSKIRFHDFHSRRQPRCLGTNFISSSVSPRTWTRRSGEFASIFQWTPAYIKS